MTVTKSPPTPPDRSIRQRVEDRWGWKFYRVLAIFTAATVGLAILADVTMWLLLGGYSPIRQTISAAAAGPHAVILDGALVILSIGVAVLTVAFILRGGDSWRSYIARAALVVLALALLPIALYNGYSGKLPSDMWLHKLYTAIAFFTVPIILWMTPTAPPRAPDREIWIGRGLAIAFLVLGPLFSRVPDAVIGLYERSLAGIALGAVLTAAWQLYCHPERGG